MRPSPALSTGPSVDLDRPPRRTVRQRQRHHRDLREGRAGAAPLDGPRAGPGRHAALARGAQYAIGPAIEDGFYYDFELPGRRSFHRRGPRPHRAPDARDRGRGPALRPRGASARDEGLETLRRPAVQAEIIERVDGGGEVGDGAVISAWYRTYRNDGAFVDLCRGPHVPTTGRLGHFKLTARGRRLLARRRAPAAAAAHLRDGVGVRGRARRAPAPPRGGRAARPPAPRCRARPVLLPRRRSARACRSSTRRAASSAS